jgi:hypothetical protein
MDKSFLLLLVFQINFYIFQHVKITINFCFLNEIRIYAHDQKELNLIRNGLLYLG